MKEDYVTKQDLKEALEKTSQVLESRMDTMEVRLTGVETRLTGIEGRVERIEGKMEGMEDRITERVITAVMPMFEHLESQISAIAELIAPNAERPLRNEERLDQHDTILQRHNVEIKVLQEIQ